MFTINQKVITSLGAGVVQGFEFCDIRENHCHRLTQYPNIDPQYQIVRVGVKLDNPDNWSLGSDYTIPYFAPESLTIKE